MRVGIYYTPAKDSLLTRLAEQWLGYSAYNNETVFGTDGLTDGMLARITDTPRHYGFHATLKAPMNLAEDQSLAQLEDDIAGFAANQQAVKIEKLVLKQVGNFFALVPEIQKDDLSALAGNCVKRFDAFRAPLNSAQMEKRLKTNLTDHQKAYLLDWGYPYVFDEFKFHLTLTGQVDDDEQEEVKAAIETHFDAVLNKPLNIDQLGLFVEENKETPFYISQTYPLKMKQR